MSAKPVAPRESLHIFDNGIKVYRRHLIPQQVERYASGENLHEPEEERLFLELLEESAPEGTFLDIGAAIGYYSLIVLRQAPRLRVHAFEPYSVHRSYLAENLRLNGVASAAVRIHHDAVGAASGVADFRVQHYGSSLVPDTARKPTIRQLLQGLLARAGLAAESDSGVKAVVPVITLDDFTVRHGRAELVKVDVQGFETDVLRGATQAMRSGLIRRWLIGTHGDSIHRDCVALLCEHGYKISYDSPVVDGQPDGVIVAKAA